MNIPQNIASNLRSPRASLPSRPVTPEPSLQVPQRRAQTQKECSRILGVVTVHEQVERQSPEQVRAFLQDLSESVLMGQLAQQRRRPPASDDYCARAEVAPAPPKLRKKLSLVSLSSPEGSKAHTKQVAMHRSALKCNLESRFSDYSSCDEPFARGHVSKFSDASSLSEVSGGSSSLESVPLSQRHNLRTRSESGQRAACQHRSVTPGTSSKLSPTGV